MRSLFNSKGECNSYYAMLGDWSFDKFYETCQTTKAIPIKGVYPSSKASKEERFVAFLKRDFADYIAKYESLYDCRFVRIEDIFKAFANEYCFSDYYKDIFNQKPHLDTSFYLYAMGYTNVGGLRFCMQPFSVDIENALWSAKAYREYLLSLA